jgi:hypothetical protein
MEVMKRALVLAASLTFALPALADAPEKTIQIAAAAVERGAFDQAVDELEALSDRGFSHPAASYARARAYLERARSRSARPGDLGRAVAALEEYRRLRPGEAQVDRALETIRAELGRRRARRGGSPIDQGTPLGRAVVGLVSEEVWAILAVVGSALLTIGLLLRRTLRARSAEIAGATAIVSGLVLGLLGAGMTRAAQRYRLTSKPAVVVATEARLYDPEGRALPQTANNPNVIPEGALVYVHGRRDAYFDVEWGSIRGQVDATQLRLVGER